jgi:hypothetical protein
MENQERKEIWEKVETMTLKAVLFPIRSKLWSLLNDSIFRNLLSPLIGKPFFSLLKLTKYPKYLQNP